MQEMTTQRAFWQAVATVTPAVLIALMIPLYFRFTDAEMWLISLAVILVPAAVLLLVLFIRYRKGHTPPQLTRQQHFTRAVMYVLLAIGNLIINVRKYKYGWTSLDMWLVPCAWLLYSLIHLHHAYQKQEGLSEAQ